MTPKWTMLHPQMTLDALGYLPGMLNDRDPRPARQQLDTNGPGGWDPMKGFTLTERNELIFPGDPPLTPLAECCLRAELIMFYEHAWVVIKQPDQSWEVARMD